MRCWNCNKKKKCKKGCSVQHTNNTKMTNNNVIAQADPCNSSHPNTKGQVKHYENSATINGQEYVVENKNYYDNYYTKYNHYYVKDINYVTDHYSDYNVYHYNTETVYNGSVCEGSTDIVENNNSNQCYNKGCNCSCCSQKRPSCMGTCNCKN